MQIEGKGSIRFPFRNDVFFKYMLINWGYGLCHAEAGSLKKLRIEGSKNTVLNRIPEAFSENERFLDVVLEDKTGHLYDLEMQVFIRILKEELPSFFNGMATAWLAN